MAGDLTFDAAAGPLQPAVYREDTYSVLDLAPAGGGLRLEVEVYGTQTITLAPGFEPGEVTVEAGRLRILARRDNPALGTMALRVAGHDLQGERGSLVVRQKDPRGAGQSI